MLKNLTSPTPEDQRGSSNRICIDRLLFTELYDRLYDRLCNNHSKPRYWCVDRADVQQLCDDKKFSSLVEHQDLIIESARKMLEKIDDEIMNELDGTGIEAYYIEEDANPKKPLLFGTRAKGEVPYRIYGTLRHYTATRAWNYWIVTGETSKELARIIYNDDVGRQYIRTNGYAGNDNPDHFSRVSHYHIDSKDGLIRFAKLVNQYYDKRKPIKRQKA